ncbi:vesicle-associated membrane protein 5-like isoform 1-T1 [Ciconia maguari]
MCPRPHGPPLPRGARVPGVPTRVPRPQAGLARCQREAEEVAELMKQNLTRALERDGRLSDLDSRAQELRAMGEAFTRNTRAVARQQRRGHRRWRLALAAIGLAALLLLLLALGLALWLSRPPPATVTGPRGTPPGGEPAPGTSGSLPGLGETLQ